MFHLPTTFHPHDPAAPSFGPQTLTKPPRGLSASCVTAEDRVRIQAAAAAVDAAIEALIEVCVEAGLDLSQVMPDYDLALVQAADLASNKVELETEEEREARRTGGWLTEAETDEYEAERAELRARLDYYNATR